MPNIIAAPIDLTLNSKNEIEPAKTIPMGKFESVICKLPLDCNATRVFVKRDGWPDTGGDVIEIKKWFSFDDGATWLFGGSSTHVGGDWVHRDGNIMADSILTTFDIPNSKANNRLIKIELNPMVPLDTAISIQAAQIIKPVGK